MRFYDRFRSALGHYAEGVHLVGPPAAEAALVAAEERLGQALPPAYRDFLRQWNGALLFHEEVVLFGVAGTLPELERLAITSGLLEIGSCENLSLRLDAEGRVLAWAEDTERTYVMGSRFERWLEATMARGALLYDRQGEFRPGVFEGEELAPRVVRKRAEAGVKADPEAPAWHEELARCLLEGGERERACAALERVVALDAGAADAWSTLGRLRQEAGELAEALAAFAAAAAAERTPEEAAFALARAAQVARSLGHEGDAARLSAEATARHPPFVAEQRAAAAHLLEAQELAEAIERLELALAVAPSDPELGRMLSHARARRSLRPL